MTTFYGTLTNTTKTYCSITNLDIWWKWQIYVHDTWAHVRGRDSPVQQLAKERTVRESNPRGPVANPASCTTGNRSLPVVKRTGRGVKDTRRPSAEVTKKQQSCTPTPQCVFMACSGVNDPFSLGFRNKGGWTLGPIWIFWRKGSSNCCQESKPRPFRSYRNDLSGLSEIHKS